MEQPPRVVEREFTGQPLEKVLERMADHSEERRVYVFGSCAVSACHRDFSVDSVTADLLPCTPPGWQERVTLIELAPCIITVMRLEQLPDGNPIPDEERTKVEKSLRAV